MENFLHREALKIDVEALGANLAGNQVAHVIIITNGKGHGEFMHDGRFLEVV